MSAEWKPGDVAMLAIDSFDHGRARRVDGGWRCLDDDYLHSDAAGVVDARPLVVIDPENREQVESLMPPNWVRTEESLDWFQSHIRSLVAPPSREEALVEIFKAAWHAADARGETGSRTTAGIAAVLAELEQADPR